MVIEGQKKPMNPEVKANWLQALRSGEYPKGRLQLKVRGFKLDDKPRYCCLGVLCELYLEETKEGKWEEDSLSFRFESEKEIRGDFPPKEVLKWAGLDSMNGSFYPDPNDKNIRSLSSINDNENSIDFSEVIETIEKYF